MAEVFRYRGWKIHMYYDDHEPPHFHLMGRNNEFRVKFNGDIHSTVFGDPKNVDWRYIRRLCSRNTSILNYNWYVARTGNGRFRKLR